MEGSRTKNVVGSSGGVRGRRRVGRSRDAEGKQGEAGLSVEWDGWN